jgi:hypothetical protein
MFKAAFFTFYYKGHGFSRALNNMTIDGYVDWELRQTGWIQRRELFFFLEFRKTIFPFRIARL